MSEHKDKKEAKGGSFSKKNPHAYDFLMLTAAGTTVVLVYIALTYVFIPRVMPALSAPSIAAAAKTA